MSLKERLKAFIKTTLYPFQQMGMRYIKRSKGRILVGDDMGLGKTIQVLSWLAVNPSKKPVIIITPASAKYNWEDQIKEHTKMKCVVLSGQKPYPITESIAIINYDIISYWKEDLIKFKPCVMVLDECHYVKNRGTKRTKTCKELSRKMMCVVPMSGTPLINGPVEFFPVLNMIDPKEFSSFWKYAFKYCDPKPGWRGRGYDFTGASNLKHLRKRIKPYFFRRTKKQVLKQLPEKRRTILTIDINNTKEYFQAKENFLEWYKEKGNKITKKLKRAQAWVKLGQLKQLVAKGKLKTACQWIDDFLSSTQEKLVVFVYHRKIFNKLIEKYKKIAAVGGKAGKERQRQVKKFQTDPGCTLFIGTIKADKESITLTASSTVLFLELGWTPSEHDQAEDRVNRIGQTDNKINMYYMLGKNTIDQHVWEIIERKRKVINQIMGGKSRSHTHTSFSNIIRLLKGK